jgi:hypothetical protein
MRDLNVMTSSESTGWTRIPFQTGIEVW